MSYKIISRIWDKEVASGSTYVTGLRREEMLRFSPDLGDNRGCQAIGIVNAVWWKQRSVLVRHCGSQFSTNTSPLRYDIVKLLPLRSNWKLDISLRLRLGRGRFKVGICGWHGRGCAASPHSKWDSFNRSCPLDRVQQYARSGMSKFHGSLRLLQGKNIYLPSRCIFNFVLWPDWLDSWS